MACKGKKNDAATPSLTRLHYDEQIPFAADNKIMEATDNNLTFLTMLQMSDTGFPTGGFSHSMGLECAEKHGTIKSNDEIRNFLIACLENTGSQQLPFVRASYHGYSHLDTIKDLDKHCESSLPNHVMNRASQRQGRSFTETCSKAFPGRQLLAEVQQQIFSGLLIGHFPVMFGAVCHCMDVSLSCTVHMYMFTTLKNMIAAAVRIGRLGAMEAQSLQFELQQIIPDIIQRSSTIDIDNVHVKFPTADILQNLHDTLFSKLFYS